MYMSRNSRVALAFFVIALGILACGRQSRKELTLYPTPTPNATQTPVVVQITTTAVFVVVEVSQTPNAAKLCVNALVAVHLRPTPNDNNYPITVIPDGTQLADLGGRSGKWMFVQLGDRQGWVHGNYVGNCK